MKIIDWNALAARYPFVREILDQPRAMRDWLTFYTSSEGKAMLERFRAGWASLQPAAVVMTGMGSSLFASHLAAMHWTGEGIPVSMVDTGELLHYTLASDVMAPFKNVLLVFTSQSGESGEIVKALDITKEDMPGTTTWGVSNNESSTLARNTTLAGFLKAGEETSVTSKTFVNALMFMHVLGRVTCMDAGKSVEEFLVALHDDVSSAMTCVTNLLDTRRDVGRHIVEFLGEDIAYIEFIARGTSLATAWQAALNVRETNKIPAGATSGGQFRHGPIEMINDQFRAVVFSSDEATRDLQASTALRIAREWGGGKVVFVSNRHVPELDGEPRVMQVVHDVSNPFLAPVAEIVIVQLFMIALAVATGVPPGEFTRASKVTTEG